MQTHLEYQKSWRINDEGFDDLTTYISYQVTLLTEKGKDVVYIDELGVFHKFEAVNSFPQLKEYEIWMEGYSKEGNNKSTASLLAKVQARNFLQACHIAACESYFAYANKINQSDYDNIKTINFNWDYNPSKLTMFGCRLFWDEQLARKSHG